MKRKGWFIPILVFFISTWVLIMYNQSTREPSLAQTSDLAQLPWDKESSEIQKIVFSSHSSVIEATRNQNNWFITKPTESIADPTYIYNIISQFVSPGVIHTIETDVTDPSSYGIYEYSPSITLYDLNNIEYKLIAGNSADETTYYTYSPLTKCIYTIKKEIFDFVSTDLSYWRSKDYLSFSPQDTSKINISLEGSMHTLLPSIDQEGIHFYSETLSSDKVNSIIAFLSTSKVENFIIDGAPSHIASSYGFDTPPISLTIYDQSGGSKSFAFALPHDKPFYYALDKNTNNIYKVPLFKMAP